MTGRQSQLETVQLRGLRHQIRRWGDPAAPRLFMLHGWMDTSASFQFVVDALAGDWHVIAQDWRGHGGSEYLGRPYWFPDYYADLDALLDHLSPNQPATLIGHSMGGAIASIYAAVRPARVARLAMLDYLGLKTASADEAPARLHDWLEAQHDSSSLPRLRHYRDTAALARRLAQVNPRLSAERALFLAEHTSRRCDDGQIELACDPWHKVPSPLPYRVEEAMALWRKIECPVLLAVASHGFIQQRFGQDPAEFDRRRACFSQATMVRIDDASHNLHHDQPVAVAQAIEAFL